MKTALIIRAWKDPEFRSRLSAQERDSVPDSPSGQPMTELPDDQLREIIGGRKLPDVMGGNTGCCGPYRPTCGIVMCPIRAETF